MGADIYLTSTARIREWLGIPESNTDADQLLSRMNRTCSAFILNHLNRNSLSLTTYRELYDGYGKDWMLVRNNPLFDVSLVSFNGVPIQQSSGDGFSAPLSGGWSIEPGYNEQPGRRIIFSGYVTPRVRNGVAVAYRSGFVFTETAVVPLSVAYTWTTTNFWLGDVSVTASDGTVLTKVSGTPGMNQYSVSSGVYTFNSGNAGDEFEVAYSYVPPDIENAVIEMVGERYKYMDRIGVVSKALGGQETVSFSQKEMSSFIKANLTPYINVVPI